jgi:acetyl-CoA C-acetyltransferase
MTVYVQGYHHTQFGRLDNESVESLIVTAAQGALENAGVDAEDIDAVYLGWYNGGFSKQDFGSSLVMNAIPQLRFKPATRVENACATGSAAIHNGANYITSGRGHNVLVIGVEKMTDTPPAQIGRILLQGCYMQEEAQRDDGFAGLFGEIARGYFKKYGDQSDALAAIAAKNHKHGCDNPFAQIRKDLGFEFCRTESDKNPLVAAPLKRTDCSLVSDGAAAMVLSDTTNDDGIALRAMAQVNDFLPMSKRDMTSFEGCRQAWQLALDEAGICLDDLDLVETHDCFTIAELMQYEAMGLAEPGQGYRVALDGVSAKQGRLPINLSGGLKSKGHPIGATGVSMHIMAAMQLNNGAGDMQIDSPGLAGVFNMGGAGVANYCSILEKTG